MEEEEESEVAPTTKFAQNLAAAAVAAATHATPKKSDTSYSIRTIHSRNKATIVALSLSRTIGRMTNQ